MRARGESESRDEGFAGIDKQDKIWTDLSRRRTMLSASHAVQCSLHRSGFHNHIELYRVRVSRMKGWKKEEPRVRYLANVISEI